MIFKFFCNIIKLKNLYFKLLTMIVEKFVNFRRELLYFIIYVYKFYHREKFICIYDAYKKFCSSARCFSLVITVFVPFTLSLEFTDIMKIKMNTEYKLIKYDQYRNNIADVAHSHCHL